MKKLVLAMLVAAMAVPAFAAVNINATDEGNGVLKLWYECTENEMLRGIALRIEADGNATIANNGAATVLALGEIGGKSFGFNTYMDYAFTVESDTPGFYDIDLGHPLAKADERGELDSFPASVFSISMGALDQLGEQAGVGGMGELMTIQFDLTADAVISISLDTLRGGVVGDGVEVVNVQESRLLAFDVPTEAIKDTAPFYAAWVEFGRPDCWAYQRNCRGDADGQRVGNVIQGFRWVTSDDLAVLIAAFNVLEPALKNVEVNGIPGICADFDRQRVGNVIQGFRRVTSDDLAVLIDYFNKLEPAVPVCDNTHYNFWTN